MAHVLLIGITPEEVDFSDPALPPGMSAASIRAGVVASVAALTAAGHTVNQTYIPIEPADALAVLNARLAAERFDIVVIGGGVIVPPRNRPLFEAMLNAIARCHPAPAIGLIERPDLAAAAVARVLG